MIKRIKSPIFAMLLLQGFIIIFTIISCKKADEPEIIRDGDGNIYDTVIIGTQVWLSENLKTTKYNDGSEIAGITDPVIWSTAYKPAYCWYGNDSLTNKNIYGGLYNLFAVNSGKLCPVGWHVPDVNDWDILVNFLGGESIAANKMKDVGVTHWHSSTALVTNSTGFTALPGGLRGTDGSYLSKDWYGYWWSLGNSTSQGNSYCLSYESGQIYKFLNPGILGMSVRCLKNKL